MTLLEAVESGEGDDNEPEIHSGNDTEKRDETTQKNGTPRPVPEPPGRKLFLQKSRSLGRQSSKFQAAKTLKHDVS